MDKGTSAAFYPFFSAFQNGVPDEHGDGGCVWGWPVRNIGGMQDSRRARVQLVPDPRVGEEG